MPRAGLSEASLGLLRSAVADEQTVQRYRAKTRAMPGSSCLRWTGTVSARGHGRFWLGESDGRDVVVIAHRFAWALEFGVEDLHGVSVLGHRCDNPLCQRIRSAPDGSVHVQRSSPHDNAREWASRRHAYGTPLLDSRGSRGRARTIRDLLRSGATGATGAALAAALGARLLPDAAQQQLWEDEPEPALEPTLASGEDELLDVDLVGAAR